MNESALEQLMTLDDRVTSCDFRPCCHNDLVEHPKFRFANDGNPPFETIVAPLDFGNGNIKDDPFEETKVPRVVLVVRCEVNRRWMSREVYRLC